MTFRKRWLWLAVPVVIAGAWWVTSTEPANGVDGTARMQTVPPQRARTSGGQRELSSKNQAAMDRAARSERQAASPGAEAQKAKRDRQLLASDPSALRGISAAQSSLPAEELAKRQERAARARTLNARAQAPLERLRAMRDALPEGPKRDQVTEDLAQIERNIELRQRLEAAGEPPERPEATR